MPRHRPTVRSAALATTLVVAATFVAAPSAGAQQRVERGLAVDRDVSLRIFNLAGSLRVVGWDRDSVAVTGTLGKKQRLAFGGTRRAAKLSPDPQGDAEAGPPAALEVRVPRTARVWVKTSGASIVVEGVRGGLDLYTVDGTIVVADDPRELRAESMDGDVTVRGTPAWARVKTATGAIALRAGGSDVGLTSVSGALVLAGGPVERARLETVSGPVTMTAEMVRGGSYDVESHGGRVELRLPTALGVDLEATTLHGTIEGPSAAGLTRTDGGRKLSLVTGDAAARIAVRTFKGSIHLLAPDGK